MRGSPNEVLAKMKAEYAKWDSDKLAALVDRLDYMLDQPTGVRNRAESELRCKAALQVIAERTGSNR